MTEDTATHPGVVDDDNVSAAEATESQERPLSAREIAMEEINAKRLVELERESGTSIDDQIATQTAEAKERLPPAALDEDGNLIPVKVDGEERHVTMDDLVRNYQKGETADKRLQEASRLLREAKEASERAAQIAAQREDPKPIAAKADEESRALESDYVELYRRYQNSLYEGDENESARLFFELQQTMPAKDGQSGRAVAAIPTVDEITASVKKQLEEDSAFDQFSKSFNEIWSDPYLANIADSYLTTEIASGKHQGLNSALTAAGTATRDWMRSKGMRVDEGQRQTADLNTRLERKAGITSLPTASVRTTSTETAPADPQGVLAEMRRARGQA